MRHISEGRISQEEFLTLQQAVKPIENCKDLIINDTQVYINDLANLLRKEKESKNIRVVVIDYLGLIKNKKTFENRNSEVSYISRELKVIAKELDISIICLSQLSRAPMKEENRLPILTDLRDSGQIEADAEIVMLLHEPDQKQFPKKLIINVAKNRYGSTGELHFTFDKYIGKISDE